MTSFYKNRWEAGLHTSGFSASHPPNPIEHEEKVGDPKVDHHSMTIKNCKLLIDNHVVDSVNHGMLSIYNPSTGKLLAKVFFNEIHTSYF
jgi:hypothetical protein